MRYCKLAYLHYISFPNTNSEDDDKSFLAFQKNNGSIDLSNVFQLVSSLCSGLFILVETSVNEFLTSVRSIDEMSQIVPITYTNSHIF